MAGPARSFRDWLDHLQSQGRLKVVRRPVDLRYELAAVAYKLDGIAAVRFDAPGGHSVPVVAGICSRREDFAQAIGTAPDQLLARFAAAQQAPAAQGWRELPRGAAPCQQVVHTNGIDLCRLLPIPTHHERDAGPYITAGVLIASPPGGGWHNLAIHRLQVTGPDRLGVLLLPRHTWQLFAAAEARGEPLPVAIAIGLDPVLLLASQASTPPGVSEYQVAAALLPEPLELVRGITVDLLVPAQAEIIIEGRLLPGVREDEGPFGEFPKYYGPRSPKPVIQVTAVTHRERPIFHTIIPAGLEHLLLGAIPKEAHLFAMVRQIVPTVRGVHLTPGGTCRYHAVIAIEKRREGEAKQAICAAFAANIDVKHVVVVDEDVNIFDPHEVEWAIATRVQADRDVFIIPQALGSALDPSAREGLTAKMGIDATAPIGSRQPRDGEPGPFERIRIPGLETIRLEDYIDT